MFGQVKKEFSGVNFDPNPTDLGAHNGHENIRVSAQNVSKSQLAQVQKILKQNKGTFGPGSRINIHIGKGSFSLHVEFFNSNGSGDARNISFQSHIDRGNPNAGPGGLFTHVFVDGLVGAVFHPHDPGLDPQQ